MMNCFSDIFYIRWKTLQSNFRNTEHRHNFQDNLQGQMALVFSYSLITQKQYISFLLKKEKSNWCSQLWKNVYCYKTFHMEKGKSKMKLRSSSAAHCPLVVQEDEWTGEKSTGSGEQVRQEYWRHFLSKGISNPTHAFSSPTTVGIITIISVTVCIDTHKNTS